MSNILENIVEVKQDEVKFLRSNFTLSRFSDYQFFDTECIDFTNALSTKNEISIIAEIKKASPSKGIIRNDFNHLAIADVYMSNGADAISVLTDKKFFEGNVKYLEEIAKMKSIPLLRKDFIIDEYQVYEAKAYGADAILLISEILSAKQINELTNAAYELGMSVLLEMHSDSQLSKIDFSLNKIIGINNRDLTTFVTNIKTTGKIADKLPSDSILVSESGIQSNNDLEYLKTVNTNAILVGEHFMKSDDIKKAVLEMKKSCKIIN